MSTAYKKEKRQLENIVHLRGVNYLNTTTEKALNYIVNERPNSVYFLNAESFNQMTKSKELKNILQKNECNFPDGSGIKLASKINNFSMVENLNGTDLMPKLFQRLDMMKESLYLVGGNMMVNNMMQLKVSENHKDIRILGSHHGFFLNDKRKEQKLISDLLRKKPSFVLVALGCPLQEKWINSVKDLMPNTTFIGVGGFFDFYTENKKRAPLWMRNNGIEWMFRLMIEPKRLFKRYVVGNPKFVMDTLIDKYERRYVMNNPKIQKISQLFLITKQEIVSKLPSLKRLMDIFVVLLFSPFWVPLMCLLAIAIKLESEGPVFYSQTRVGKFGKTFKFYKLRSMKQGSDKEKKALMENNESKDGVIFKMKNDPRVTKIGRIIRKTSLDELPQLYNVLIGDMTLVGPRPPVPSEVKLYTLDDRKRLYTKQGITCIWQVSGRSEIPFKEQVKMDQRYIRERNLMKDIFLLVMTIPAVLFGKGAY